MCESTREIVGVYTSINLHPRFGEKASFKNAFWWWKLSHPYSAGAAPTAPRAVSRSTGSSNCLVHAQNKSAICSRVSVNHAGTVRVGPEFVSKPKRDGSLDDGMA